MNVIIVMSVSNLTYDAQYTEHVVFDTIIAIKIFLCENKNGLIAIELADLIYLIQRQG